MKAKELRKIARENLSGKWLKGAAITLVFVLVIYFIAFAFVVFEASILAPLAFILYIAILPPLAFSIMAQFLRLQKSEDVKVLDFIEWTTGNFTKSWKVAWHVFKKIFVLWLAAVLFIVLAIFAMTSGIMGILDDASISSTLLSMGLTFIGFIGYFVVIILLTMKMFYYYLIPYIMEDEKDLSAKEIVAKSEELMKNNRWRMFCLSLSFIGWAILSIFTFGIGLFFLIPYMQMALVAFYQERAGKLKTVDKAEIVEE